MAAEWHYLPKRTLATLRRFYTIYLKIKTLHNQMLKNLLESMNSIYEAQFLQIIN